MIYKLDIDKVPSLKEIGGKAKSLIEMTHAGFDVPEGFVLSVAFFSPWIDKIKGTSVWKNFLNEPLKEECDALKKIADAMNFSLKQSEALGKALGDISGQSIFAVRSSSPEEDLEGASFAGVYETTLGVSRENLETAIIRAFSSMLDIRVVEYKRLNHMAIDQPRIAVIVQKQIPSEFSGVAFSINPRNNCYDEAVINANFGLGETVVSGQVTPDNYIVDKVKNKISEKNIARKIHALRLEADGGTVRSYNENPKAQALSDEQIMMVAELVTRCEVYYEKPMDIEWAIYDSKLYLLQARPITTYIPFFSEMLTEAGKEKNLYLDLIVISQGFGEALSVMGQEIWTKMLMEAKMGLMPEGKDGIVLNIHGRQYINVSNWLKALGGKVVRKSVSSYETPIRKIFDSIDLKNEYTPSVKSDKIKKVTMNFVKVLWIALPIVFKSLLNPKNAGKNYKNDADDIFRYCKENLLKEQLFSQMVDEGIGYFTVLVRSVMGIVVAFYAQYQISKIFKGENVDDLLVSLGMDLPHNPTSEMGYYMLKLASYNEIQNTESGEVFAARLRNQQYSNDFLKDYNDYMERFGSRGFKEIDIATPRAYEHPEVFFTQLKHMNIDDNRMNTVKARKEKAYGKLLILAKDKGKEKKFVKYSEIYNNLVGYREHPKYIYVVVVDVLRRRALEIGELFKSQGRLESADQIFNLTIEQVTEAEKNPNLALMPLVEKNLAPRKVVEHIKDWPKIVDSRGKIFRYIRESEEGDLMGDAIAPGIVRGKAKVLHRPYEKQIEKGEILVARSTEPAWTPIFVNAVGIVLEIGGPLQHGAIIAREYGIPCVSGVDRATEIIKDGDFLEVDGSSGIVKIIR